MECCIGVSTETVFQIDKSYIEVREILKMTFRTFLVFVGVNALQRTTVGNVSYKILLT